MDRNEGRWHPTGSMLNRFCSSTLVAMLLVAAHGSATYATQPLTAEERYEAARGLMVAGKTIEAASAFRSIAEADDVPQALREQALFVCGLMYQNARDYERALAIYEEVQRRFPGTSSAVRAAGSAGELLSSVDHGIEFRRRQDEAWDQMEPAIDLAVRQGQLSAARPALQRAETLLLALLRDFGDHPKAKDVAMALGIVYRTLHQFADAQGAFTDAMARARRSMASEDPGLASFLSGVERELHEAILAQRRQRITSSAEATIVAIGAGLLVLAPWRIRERWILHVAGSLTIAALGLALVAALLSYAVRLVDQMSPIEATQAGLLVALPAIVGQLVALGFIGALQAKLTHAGWRVHGLSGALGIVAACAVAVYLVDVFNLFPFLDSDL